MRFLTAARQAGGFDTWAACAADGGVLRRLLQRGVCHGLVRCLRCWRDAAAAKGDARSSRCGVAARLALRGLALAWVAWAAAAAAAAARAARARLASTSARRSRTQRVLRALREHALRRRALSRAFRGLARAAGGARAASGAARQLTAMAVRCLCTRLLRFGWNAWRGRLGEAARLLQLGRRVGATKAHLRLAAGLAAFRTQHALGHASSRRLLQLRDACTQLAQLRIGRAWGRWAAAAAARGAMRAAVARLLLGRAGRALEAWAAAVGQRASAALLAQAALCYTNYAILTMLYLLCYTDSRRPRCGACGCRGRRGASRPGEAQPRPRAWRRPGSALSWPRARRSTRTAWPPRHGCSGCGGGAARGRSGAAGGAGTPPGGAAPRLGTPRASCGKRQRWRARAARRGARGGAGWTRRPSRRRSHAARGSCAPR